MGSQKFDHDKVYYKILANNMINKSYRFKIGLNLLYEPWLETESMNGGFYFCDLLDVPEWLHLYPNGYVCEISVPYDAIVRKQVNKYKTNKIIISKPIKYPDFIEMHGLESRVVEHDGLLLCYIKNKTQAICMKAIKQCVIAFKYLDPNNQTKELCEEVVKHNGLYLKLVNKQLITPEMCVSACENNGMALGYVPRKYHNYDLYCKAIKNNSLALRFIFLSILTDCQCNELFNIALKH